MKKFFKEYGIVLVGVVVASIGLDGFLIPNKIAAGGVSGIATILYHLFGFPVGVSMLVINVPLFLIGGRVVGKGFFFKTLFATVVMSVFIDLVPTPVLSTDMILATVYGGALMGLGLGLVIYAGATTGGTDMAAGILHAKTPSVSIATYLFIIDIIVIIVAALVFNPAVALYAVASLYLSTKLIDVVLQGFKTGKAFFIITDHAEQIKEAILHDLDRGVTMLEGMGGYSGQRKNVLLCVVRRNDEVIKLKTSVKEIDENAFMIATNVTEVLGEGFSE